MTNSKPSCSAAIEAARKDGPKPEEQLLILKEEFLAFRYLTFMGYVFRHLRNSIRFVVAGVVLSMFIEILPVSRRTLDRP